MRKLSLLVQWIILLGIAGFFGHMLLRRPPQPDHEPETWRSWEGVTVLSYAGIARRDGLVYPSTRRLEEHLHALREAGYRTVRPEEVRAFLDGRSPLPSKALMLIFEGGRKEAFIRATPVLQQTGFMAVIAIPTAVTDEWGGFYVKRSDLKRLARMPQWQPGSMGHEAHENIPVAPDGVSGRFLTQRRLLEDGTREDSAAYQERVLHDYQRSAQLIESAAGRPALLYLYPYADSGRFPGADPLAAAVNREGVTRYFELAFTEGLNAFNGRGSDPWSLSRLRVPGTWSAERLLEELALSRPRREGKASLGRAEDWVLDGECEFAGGTLFLPDGASAWLRGSANWSDLDVDVSLTSGTNGISALYARYTGPFSWVRVSLSPDGLRVQERLSDRIQTLHFEEWTGNRPDGEQRVRVRLRGNRVWVHLDGVQVAANLPLAAGTRSGRLGFSTEGGSVRLHSLNADLLPARLALADGLQGIPEDRRPLLLALLPSWLDASTPPRIDDQQRRDLLRAAVAGMETIPVISGASHLTAAGAADFAAAIDDELRHQDLHRLVRALGVKGPYDKLAAALRERGYRVVHLLDAAQALRQGSAIARLGKKDWIVITETGPAAEAALHDLLREMSADRIALRETDGPGFESEIETALMAHQLVWEKE